MRKTGSNKVRLPSYFKPERYRISLHPDLEGASFSGEESIDFQLTQRVKRIILHADELVVNNVSAEINGKHLEAGKISYSHKSETVIFDFKQKLPKGKGKLVISFTGILNDKMRGFYLSRYKIDGKENLMATTQFEATHARCAFPCVDEPAVKAVFDITLIVPKGHTAISNTIPSAIREHNVSHEIVEFEPTPKMSTYLAAFIVGKFEWIEKKTDKGTMVRVFVTPGKKKQAEFALEVGVKTLDFYEDYFGIKYPLPVLDMIAIPDFSSGAMENWGAVTYRETMILFDEEKSSTATKQWVALVIAHELAHQWFGNLVTMEWWTHLWLNEGFASYIEYLAIDKIFPEWDIWTQFVHSDLSRAMSLDALENTHPIEVEVRHPSEIGEIFDAVSYSKGASVIRMIADYLGEKDFREGLRHYLQKHQYGNASTKDLWLAFEHVSDKPVREIMDNWTRKPGFPAVKIENNGHAIKLSQSRFLSSSIAKSNSKDKTIWKIPMNIETESKNNRKKLLLEKKSKSISLTLKKGEWASFNSGTSGMYRLNYPEIMLLNLEKAVKGKNLPARDRFSIQDDAFSLAESGEFSSTLSLALASSYKDEDDYTVWVSLISNLETIKNLLTEESSITLYSVYIKNLLSVVAKKVGWHAKKKEKHTTPMLRSLVLSCLGDAQDKETLQKARKLFESVKKGVSLNPDLKGVVYGLTAKNGGIKEYEWFIKRHEEETLQEEKNRFLFALAKFKDKKLIKRTLEYALSEKVRPQDTPGVFSYAWGNRLGRDVAWEFTKSHWNEILKRYDKGGHILPYFIKPAASFSSVEKAREVRRFFQTHKAPGAERAIEQVIEQIYSNAAWLKRDKKKIINWLKNNT